MLRVAFIAYLCVTTVLGPSLCCCNAQQLVAMVEGAKCCGKPAHKELSVPEPRGHCSHHTDAHHRHAKPEAKDTEKSSDLPPAWHQHDKQSCPCGDHQAKLVATLTNAVHGNCGDLNCTGLPILEVGTPALPELHGDLAVLAAARATHLYGRELLRAYQIMRC